MDVAWGQEQRRLGWVLEILLLPPNSPTVGRGVCIFGSNFSAKNDKFTDATIMLFQLAAPAQ